MGSTTLSFHDFSWKGDRKWETASRWTVYGPIVVCFILLFSIVQIACGSIWLVQLGNNLSVYVSISRSLIDCAEQHLLTALRYV